MKTILLALLLPLFANAQMFVDQITVDNVRVDGNTISTRDTNGHLILSPNGTGKVEMPGLTATTVPYLDANKRVTSSAVTPTELGFLSGVTATLCGISQSCTLSGKSISGATNTFSNIPNSATTAASTNTASAIVARDGSGNFSAGTISAALTGNATTATALASNPSDCTAGQFATTIDASGNLTCSTISLAATATALAANPTDCTAGQYANAIDASGNLTCAAVTPAQLSGSIPASKLTGTDIATVGTITSGTWNGTTIAIANGGTGQTTAANALNALLPTQTGNAGQVLTTNGTVASWGAASAGTMAIGGSISSATQGSMLFAGASGVLAQDNSKLFFDDTNDRLLIGAATSYVPSSVYQPQFEVNKSASAVNSQGGIQINHWGTTAAEASVLNFNRSKSSSIGTYTAIVSGDRLGEINFMGSDGTNFEPAASIIGKVGAAPGNNDMPGNLSFQVSSDGGATLTERMSINHNGRVWFSTALHNNSGGCGASSTIGEICSGTWTTSINDGSNLQASTVGAGRYIRVGNLVTGTLSLQIDPTSATDLSFEFNIPIATNFTGDTDCMGTIGHAENPGTRVMLQADATDDRCRVLFRPQYSSNESIYVFFQYEVK